MSRVHVSGFLEAGEVEALLEYVQQIDPPVNPYPGMVDDRHSRLIALLEHLAMWQEVV